MTLTEAKALYISGGGPSDHSPQEWNDIHAEMDAIVNAKTDVAAGRLIQWWDCWGNSNTATKWARNIRRLYREIREADLKIL